jgi:chemotaxis protein MotD
MEQTTARAVDHDRDLTRRTDRRDDAESTNKRDDKAEVSQAGDDGKAPVKNKSLNADDSSADTDGKSKDGKDKSETNATDTAVAAPTPDVPQPANVNVNVTAADAAAVPAPAAPAEADAVPVPAPTTDAVQAPDTAAAPAPAPVLEAATAAAATNGKATAGKTKANTGFEIAAPVTDESQPITPDDQKIAASAATQATTNANANAAPKATELTASTAPQDGQPVAQHKNAALTNIATDVATKAEVKPEATNVSSGQDNLESALAKHFSADAHVTNASQIVLPDASRTLPNNLAPVNAPAQNMPVVASNPAVPLASAALAIEIASRSKDGSRQFDIRLDPPELGRIEVKLDVDKTGQVNTHLTVDRPETLDLLRRDSQGLERALQQAGLKTSDGGLEFSLRQQTPDGSFNDRNQAQGNARTDAPLLADSEQTATIHAEQYQWAARMRGGVDIRI